LYSRFSDRIANNFVNVFVFIHEKLTLEGTRKVKQQAAANRVLCARVNLLDQVYRTRQKQKQYWFE